MEKKDFRVGDRVLVEEAWEDETGAYHDEQAEILEIRHDGTVELYWDLGNYNPEAIESIAQDLQLSVFTLEDLTFLEREAEEN